MKYLGFLFFFGLWNVKATFASEDHKYLIEYFSTCGSKSDVHNHYELVNSIAENTNTPSKIDQVILKYLNKLAKSKCERLQILIDQHNKIIKGQQRSETSSNSEYEELTFATAIQHIQNKRWPFTSFIDFEPDHRPTSLIIILTPPSSTTSFIIAPTLRVQSPVARSRFTFVEYDEEIE